MYISIVPNFIYFYVYFIYHFEIDECFISSITLFMIVNVSQYGKHGIPKSTTVIYYMCVFLYFYYIGDSLCCIADYSFVISIYKVLIKKPYVKSYHTFCDGGIHMCVFPRKNLKC